MIKGTDTSDALFEAKIADLVQKAERYECGCSAFLTPKEQIVAKRILAEKRTDAVSFFFGGYGDSERNRLFLLPDYMAVEQELDTAVLLENYREILKESVAAVLVKGSGYRKLTHREYMGSVLGLGVERAVIGDIVVLDDFSAVVFCDPKMADFFVAS